MGLDISSLPEPLQKILGVIKIAGAIVAPRVFKEALAWVWEKEQQYVPQGILDEMKGIADGVCSVVGHSCNTTAWYNDVAQLNMLPELIRMSCTAYGAWGKATPNAGLIQLRALDFGTGPWPNYTIIAVHRGNPNNIDNAFVSVSFPAFVGAITGVSQSGVGISEKVWMTYNKRELQPGSYDGIADILVLRNILEYSKNRADAEAYVQTIPRTWGMWIGVGDYESQTFDLIGYEQSSATAYTDVTMPAETGQPFLENICYVDKHPQPSGDGPTGTLPTALQTYYGQISLETTKAIVQAHQTGDVQIASYDFTSKKMIVAIGKVNRRGQYESNQDLAYNRPYVSFDLEDLWNGK